MTQTVAPKATTPRYVRPKEAAKYASMSLATFWRMARTEPHFPKLKRPSKRITLIDLSEFEAYLNR